MLITQRHVSVRNYFKQKESRNNVIRLPPFFKVVVSLLGVLWQLEPKRSLINSLWECLPPNQNHWLAFYKLFCEMFGGETPTLIASATEFQIQYSCFSVGKIKMITSNSFWDRGSEQYEGYWFVLLVDMIRKYDRMASYRGHQDYQDVSMISIETSDWLYTRKGRVSVQALCVPWIQEWWTRLTARTEFWRNFLNFKYLVHIRIS